MAHSFVRRRASSFDYCDESDDDFKKVKKDLRQTQLKIHYRFVKLGFEKVKHGPCCRCVSCSSLRECEKECISFGLFKSCFPEAHFESHDFEKNFAGSMSSKRVQSLPANLEEDQSNGGFEDVKKELRQFQELFLARLTKKCVKECMIGCSNPYRRSALEGIPHSASGGEGNWLSDFRDELEEEIKAREKELIKEPVKKKIKCSFSKRQTNIS